jgi:hypothetical protein
MSEESSVHRQVYASWSVKTPTARSSELGRLLVGPTTVEVQRRQSQNKSSGYKIKASVVMVVPSTFVLAGATAELIKIKPLLVLGDAMGWINIVPAQQTTGGRSLQGMLDNLH